MLRYVIFSLFGPLISLLIIGVVLQPPVENSGRFVIAFVAIGFLPALVPALVAAVADEALEHRRGVLRCAFVALIGSAGTLGLCLLSRHRQGLYFAGVGAMAGGVSAACCCWLHLMLRRCRRRSAS